jgi:uncharacterized glyoxalase superfamily protein PhnB
MTTPQPVIPLLVYTDIEEAHDFLVRAFGFSPGGVCRDGDGNVVHGEVELGGTPIWLHRTTTEHELAAPGDGAQHGGLVVTVDDVDAHHRHAVASGARIDSAAADRAYGRREYGARDPQGHRWWFGTPL